MARFKYSGEIKRKKSRSVTAPSKREAMQKLNKDGIRVIEMTEVTGNVFHERYSIGNPVKLQHFVIYLRQFATLLKAGISVVDATNILAEQTESKA